MVTKKYFPSLYLKNVLFYCLPLSLPSQYNVLMKKVMKTTLIISLLSLSFGCAKLTPKSEGRIPASVSPMESALDQEADLFMKEIEEAPARRY